MLKLTLKKLIAQPVQQVSAFIQQFSPKSRRWQLRPLLLTLLFLGTAALTIALTSTPSQATPLRHSRLHRVTGGPVYLQRHNWSAFYRTASPTWLNSEDYLYIPNGTSVELLCTDGVVRGWMGLARDNVGTTCYSAARRYRPSFGISEQWGAADPTEPYVISPRAGQVLSATPMLHWHAVPEAQQYQVTLLQRTGDRWLDLWTVMSDRTSLCYPNGQPPLEPGYEYSLQVVALDEADETDRTETLTERPVFSLVDGEERQAIESAIAAVEALEIDPAAKTLILAEDVYPQHKLFARGINELTALSDSGQATAQAHRLLGEYAVRTGLELTAEASYQSAIQLAEATENLEEQALATWGLGTVYARVGKTELALSYLQQAKQLAVEIGDTEQIEAIETDLSRITGNDEAG